ncbi:MAG: transposase [Bacilli bacterium]
MITLARQSLLFPIINSIYGIGELSTYFILAELKDVTRFNNVKQLNAYCGLGLGKSINYHGHISKSGNKYARNFKKSNNFLAFRVELIFLK